MFCKLLHEWCGQGQSMTPEDVADKVKLFFDMFSQLPSWFTNLWILVVASIFGIKGTTT